MTDQNYTHLLLVVDRSGSMQSIADDMNGGIATLLDEQAKQPGDLYVDAWTFDTEIEHVAKSSEPISRELKNLVKPRGGTALLDAIGKSATDLGAYFASLREDERPGKVVVAIVTDGEENSSHEWTTDGVRKLVEQQQNTYGWQFLFLGANIDAFSVAASFGIPQANSMNFAASAAGVSNSWAATSRSVAAYRTTVGASTISGYTDEDREAATEE